MSLLNYNLNEISGLYRAIKYNSGTTDSISCMSSLFVFGKMDLLEIGLVETWLFSALEDEVDPT